METNMLRKIFLVLLSIVTFLSDVISFCPSVCHQIACQTGVLTCTDGGLSQIPTSLPAGTTIIILSNQKFAWPHLDYVNISNYGPPLFRVVKITIQNCELLSLASNSFTHMVDLNILDLSNNRLQRIAPDTFQSLNLKFLRLDGNRNISFSRYSFRGLTVHELSLIDCVLTSLEFNVIHEIERSLKKLILTNNRLKTLDKQFKTLFEYIPNLQINDNPFNCTCGLRWLGSVLSWRKKRFESELSRKKRLESPLTMELTNEAQCQSPVKVKGKRIVDLSPRDFSCDLPKLKLIDVYMTSNISANLTCISEQERYSSSDVIWMTERDNKFIYEVQSKENAALSVSKRSATDQFKCVIANDNGNVTVWITIHWPPDHSNNTTLTHSTFNVANNEFDRYLFIDNNTANVHSLIYVKRFTLLEMIGGVVGTFTITMILFLCIYRHIAISMRKNDKKKWYISYEAAVGSDSQTYDVPHNVSGPYFPGQLLTNNYSPVQYLDYNSHTSHSTPNKIAAL